MLARNIRKYVLTALSGAPDVMVRLCGSALTTPVVDFRPDPARFTIREVLAHLADWDAVFGGRIKQMLQSENATLVGIDEGEVAIAHDYARADPEECLRRYHDGRAAILVLLSNCVDDDWERQATHTELGSITLEAQAVLISAHDGYHLKQVAEWLKAGGV